MFHISHKSKGVATAQLVVALLVVAVIIVGAVVLSQQGGQPGANTPEGGEGGQKTQSFAESVEKTITGIGPGAGIMINTEKAMEEYGLNEAGWTLQKSSSAAMLSALQDAIDNNEPILATVWQPHAAFAVGDLRKLDDPKNIYNDPEGTRSFLEENAPAYADAEVKSDVLASVVYAGFQEDAPAAYAFFEEFQIDASVQSDWILKYSVQEKEPATIAENWIGNNRGTVEQWVPAEDVALGKEKITIGIPPWPGATVKSEVVAQLLEEIGYETEVQKVDVGVVYSGLADEQIDVNVAGWLPTTHQEYWEQYSDQMEIAGVNVTLTWLGLGVPSYVDEDIQSITDLVGEE